MRHHRARRKLGLEQGGDERRSGNSTASVSPSRPRALTRRPAANLQPLVTRAVGAAIPTVRQGARKRRNDIVQRSGIVLGRVGIGDLQNIARIL